MIASIQKALQLAASSTSAQKVEVHADTPLTGSRILSDVSARDISLAMRAYQKKRGVYVMPGSMSVLTGIPPVDLLDVGETVNSDVGDMYATEFLFPDIFNMPASNDTATARALQRVETQLVEGNELSQRILVDESLLSSFAWPDVEVTSVRGRHNGVMQAVRDRVVANREDTTGTVFLPANMHANASYLHAARTFASARHPTSLPLHTVADIPLLKGDSPFHPAMQQGRLDAKQEEFDAVAPTAASLYRITAMAAIQDPIDGTVLVEAG